MYKQQFEELFSDNFIRAFLRKVNDVSDDWNTSTSVDTPYTVSVRYPDDITDWDNALGTVEDRDIIWALGVIVRREVFFPDDYRDTLKGMIDDARNGDGELSVKHITPEIASLWFQVAAFAQIIWT